MDFSQGVEKAAAPSLNLREVVSLVARFCVVDGLGSGAETRQRQDGGHGLPWVPGWRAGVHPQRTQGDSVSGLQPAGGLRSTEGGSEPLQDAGGKPAQKCLSALGVPGSSVKLGLAWDPRVAKPGS